MTHHTSPNPKSSRINGPGVTGPRAIAQLPCISLNPTVLCQCAAHAVRLGQRHQQPVMAALNTVAFPGARSARSSVDDISVLSLSHHRAAAEICELFYGASPPAWQAVERLYDPNATYENPFITATSKDTIASVHALARYLSQLDVPKPGAVLCALFRMSGGHRSREAWFRGVSMWNEINDISECESFGEPFSPDRRSSAPPSAPSSERYLCIAQSTRCRRPQTDDG